MRVLAYTRVSTAEQAEGFSLDAQRAAIAGYCRLRDWPDPVYYQDAGVSAHTDDLRRRPAFARLLADVEGRADRHAPAVVVVHKLDRLARSLAVTLETLKRLEAANVAFVSVAEQLDFATPIGKVSLAMLGALAQYFSDNLALEVRKGIAQKRAAGQHVGGVPYGARRVDGALALHPERAAALARVLDLAAVETPGRLATRLNAEGVPTARGGAWQPRTIAALIARSAWLLDQPPPWPERYRAAVARAPAPRVRADRTVYMLSGLLRCPCGGRLVVNRRRSGRCYGSCYSRRLRPGGFGCALRHLPLAAVEDTVTAWLLALPDLAGVQPETRDVSAERAALAERRRRLGQSYRNLELGEAEYERERRELDRLEALLPAAPVSWRQVRALVRHAQAEWDQLLPPARNAVLRHLLAGVLVEADRAVVLPLPAVAAQIAASGGG